MSRKLKAAAMVRTELKSLYEGYIEDAKRAERERKPGEGLLGIGKTPADDPCHDRFVREFEMTVSQLCDDGLNSTDMLDQLYFIYEAPLENREPASAYWMLLAVHGKTLPMIEKLDKEDAGELSRWYKDKYPRSERFPAQKQVIESLKRREKN